MNCADPKHLEFYQFNMSRLEKERMKITQRGRLSPAEDLRLDEIDDELEFWKDMVEEVFGIYESEYTNTHESEDVLEYMAMLDRMF